MLNGRVPSRPRILVVVEPRVLADVLVAVLAAVDLDDVVVEANGRPVDAAIVSADVNRPVVDLVIQLPGADTADLGWIHACGTSDPVALATTGALLALLDERLAATGASRAERAAALTTTGGGAR